MKQKPKLPYLRNIPFVKSIYASFILNTLTLVLVLVLKDYLPPEVPLFYGSPEGENQLTTSLYLIIPSVSSFLILAINLLLAFISQDDLLKKMLLTVVLAVSILSTITTIKIVLLVGSF